MEICIKTLKHISKRKNKDTIDYQLYRKLVNN